MGRKFYASNPAAGKAARKMIQKSHKSHVTDSELICTSAINSWKLMLKIKVD